jgi:hypothetical protein
MPCSEDQIVSLYGRITNEWYTSKKNAILEQAAVVQDSLASGLVTTQAVQNLALRIGSFKDKHLPSRQDRREIAQAEEILMRARCFLTGEEHIEAKSVLAQHEEPDSISIEEAESLLQIAACIHRSDGAEAKIQHHQLSMGLKTRFLEHMDTLGAEAFTDALATKQALIAMANELLANGEGYPTPAQIEALFSGLSRVLTEEKAGQGLLVKIEGISCHMHS